jgi:hypothetical protein
MWQSVDFGLFLLLNRTFLNWIVLIQSGDSQNQCELFHEILS